MSDRVGLVQAVAVVNAGLVTAVGLSAAASCAAVRAGITNHSETRFMGPDGEWILGAQVPLEQSLRGRAKLLRMAGMAIREVLSPLVRVPERMPLLLCVAERDRPGRLDGIEEALFGELEADLGLQFHPDLSVVVPQGRAGVLIALDHARRLIVEQGQRWVLVAATDSLLVAATLAAYGERERLLTSQNSNGFIPGEAAGALLLGAADGARTPELVCLGVGFGVEKATVESEEPLRAEGLVQAIKGAVANAGCGMGDLDFRITDNSGEQYYFKEATLSLSRTLRVPKAEFDIWHPADCIGEVGAAVGAAMLAKALSACRKAYARGSTMLVHCGTDAGRRAAAVLRYRTAV